MSGNFLPNIGQTKKEGVEKKYNFNLSVTGVRLSNEMSRYGNSGS